jgi:DAACS family dicarboxylate/amino acid:cation (Na+ or H+) symporter
MRPVHHTAILIGAAVGAAGGVAAHLAFAGTRGLELFVAYGSRPVGQVFLRLLFMLVIPLIVSALAMGVAELGDLKRLGRIGLRTLALTTVVSAIAVMLGIGLVNFLSCGRG